MKTEEHKKESNITRLRKIRERVSRDIQDMTYKEIKEYLERKKPLHPKFEREK